MDYLILYSHFQIIKSHLMTSIDHIEEIRSIFFLLEHNIKSNQDKISAQQKIFTEFYRIFQKTSLKLVSLAGTISDQVLKLNNQQQYIVQYYQMLSNCVLRIADCSSRVSLRCKSQILDPIKTFNQNYQNIYNDLIKKISQQIHQITTIDHQNHKLKENYYQAYQKFQKHKEAQRKVMDKIESGNKSQLQKLNNMTKKLSESIQSNEKLYQGSVTKLNNFWSNIRSQFATINQSITYNQTTRISFFKKTIVNSIKTLQQFNNGYDYEIIKKMQQITKQQTKNQQASMKKMKHLFQKIIQNKLRQQFISYEDMIRIKNTKNKEIEVHLAEHFSKIKEKDKKIINDLVLAWFSTSKKITSPVKEELLKDKQLQKRRNGSLENEKIMKKHEEKIMRQLDQAKEKIISQPHYSFYFVEFLYENIVEMTSFYCKLNEDHFIYLLNAFTVISKNLDVKSDIGIQFMYKMMVISLRIMVKKNKIARQGANQTIQLLCEKYGKNNLRIRDPKLLMRILAYIQKRKVKKKSGNDNKITLNTIAKGFFNAFKKNPTLNQEETFNCLEELTKIISNFSIPNEIILPFIKQTLGNNQQTAYDYLKGIILNKKDVEQRQSLFFRKEIKEKKQQLFKKAVENKKMAAYAISIVAQRGFLGQQQLHFRIICLELKNVHLSILYNLKMPTQKKWIRLIPVDKKLSYIQMKQQVAQKSVPSATQQIITLDVNRSLHMHGEFLNPTILHSLLRIYAYFHPDISYCQGMNYLAGYLYIKTLNEQYTYRIFQYIMQTRFKEIFVNEFQILKIKMYQFERLLAIFHPQISEHFKRQSISPECYIVSWIITLFASSYQYTLSSYIIDFLWQRFIIKGWPQFFKFVIWIFSLYKEDLIQLTYDKALHFLGELSRSEFFLANQEKFKEKFYSIENPMQGIERYPISQQLLDKFNQQYRLDK